MTAISTLLTNTTPARFWEKVKRCDGDGCWEWQAGFTNGPRSKKKHYGCFHLGNRGEPGRRMYAAHRVAWELENGPVPDGMKVLHSCDNMKCVRPSHLFLGTQLENVIDMINKGRAWWQK